MSVSDFILRGISAVAALASAAVILAVEGAILSVASPAALFGAGPILALPWALPITLGKYAYYGTIDDEKIAEMNPEKPLDTESIIIRNNKIREELEKKAESASKKIESSIVKNNERREPVSEKAESVSNKIELNTVKKNERQEPVSEKAKSVSKKIESSTIKINQHQDSVSDKEKSVPKKSVNKPEAEIPVKPPITQVSQVSPSKVKENAPHQTTPNKTVVKRPPIPVPLTEADYENKYSSEKKTTPVTRTVSSTQAPTPPPVPPRPKTKKVSEVSVIQSKINVDTSADSTKRVGSLNNRDEIAKKLEQLNNKEKDKQGWTLVASKPDDGKDAPVIMAKGKERLHAERDKYLTTSSNIDALVSMLKYFELKHPGQKIKIAAQGDRKQLWEEAYQKMKTQEPNSKIKMEVTSPVAVKAPALDKGNDPVQRNERRGPGMR